MNHCFIGSAQCTRRRSWRCRATVIYFSIAFPFLICSCRNETSLEKLQNPHLDAFRNRNISYVVTFSSVDSTVTDTTFFDKVGSVIRIVEPGKTKYVSENSLHYPTRMLQVNDDSSGSNIVTEYTRRPNGNLWQKHFNVGHLHWAIKNSDPRELLDVVEFEIDDRGRVSSRFDSLTEIAENYFYDDQNRVITREGTFPGAFNEIRTFKWFYYYDSKGLVERIRYVQDEEEHSTYYYSNGLLDSAILDGEVFKSRYFNQ
jgi:hypothetical protein